MGLYVHLFSVGKSVFLYSPPLLVSLFCFHRFSRRFRAETILFLGIALTYLLVYSRVMAVNAGGPFRCIRAVFPYMKEKGGKIINIASAIIFEGVPGVPHYVASKGAVMALSRCMAKELGGFDINVNAIAPGFTHSEGGDRFDQNKQLVQVPLEELQLDARCLKRTTQPEDLVGTAIFLASEDSRNITGQLIVVDCGMNFH